jgi:DNA-binding MarR family transcriptional regulator
MSDYLPPNAFVRFLNLMHAISVLPVGIKLDPQEERVMQELGLRWGRGDSVTVLAAMNMMPEASPSTVQRRLKSLRAKGLLSFESAPHDARVRHVVPTSQATAYFDGMSDLMQRAVDRR